METNIIIGIIVLVCAYSFFLYLILWSRQTIELIAKRNVSTIREIIEELNHGGKTNHNRVIP